MITYEILKSDIESERVTDSLSKVRMYDFNCLSVKSYLCCEDDIYCLKIDIDKMISPKILWFGGGLKKSCIKDLKIFTSTFNKGSDIIYSFFIYSSKCNMKKIERQIFDIFKYVI